MAGEGIELVKPTSVSVSNGSASITALGAVDFTSASVVSIDGVFTSVCDNYMILFRNTTNRSGGASTRYRVAGVDAASGDYNLITTQVNGPNTPTGSQTLSASQAAFADIAQQGSVEHYVYSPALAEPTVSFSYGVRDGGGNFTLIQNNSTVHTASVAYDGITILLNANDSGQVAIYGLEK